MTRYTLTAQDRLDCADILFNPPARFETIPDMEGIHSMGDALRYVLALGERAQFFEWNDDLHGNSFWNVPLAMQIIGDGREPNAEVPLVALLPVFPRVGIDRMFALSSEVDAARPVIVAPLGERSVLIDGWHRAYKALFTGHETLTAYELSVEEAEQVKITNPYLLEICYAGGKP